jgi:hypothetical protein
MNQIPNEIPPELINLVNETREKIFPIYENFIVDTVDAGADPFITTIFLFQESLRLMKTFLPPEEFAKFMDIVVETHSIIQPIDLPSGDNK